MPTSHRRAHGGLKNKYTRTLTLFAAPLVMSTKQTVEGTLDRLTAQIFHCLTVPLRPLYHVVKEMTGASGSWAKLVMRFTDLTGKGLYAELRGKSRADVLQKAEPYLKAPIQVKNLKTTKNNFFPHISVWGSSFVGWHPARIRRSFRPPRPLLRRSLTLTHSLTHSFFTSLTHSLTQHKISRLTHSLTHSPHSLTHSLTLPEPVIQRLQKGLRRALSPLGPPLSPQAQYPEPPEGAAASLSAVAGAVPRASRRGCGARCRRWAPLALCSGRRSTQSLQNGAAARVVAAGPPSLSAVAGAVPRASRKGLRRALSPLGPPRSLQWQAQYPEPPEGAAARVVAAGPPAVLCVTAIVICNAMVVTGCESHCNGCGQDVRTLCLCTTAILISIVLVLAGSESHCKCCEKDVCGARRRRWAPLALCSGRRSTQSLQKGLRRALSPLGPPRSLQWQAQYPEPPEGAAAHVVAAGPPAVLCVTAIVICKAMVVTGCESHCNGCGQDVRTLCLCTTAIVISIVLVLAGSESHCKCCEKDVCEVCLCTGAIVICRTSVCAARKSPCKCCIEVVCEVCLCAAAIVICKERGLTACESHCNGCGKDACKLSLRGTAIVYENGEKAFAADCIFAFSSRIFSLTHSLTPHSLTHSLTSPHLTSPHLTPPHPTPLHSTPLHSTPLHSTPLHSTPLHSTHSLTPLTHSTHSLHSLHSLTHSYTPPPSPPSHPRPSHHHLYYTS